MNDVRGDIVMAMFHLNISFVRWCLQQLFQLALSNCFDVDIAAVIIVCNAPETDQTSMCFTENGQSGCSCGAFACFRPASPRKGISD
jgi:hypothetical protein